MRRVYITDGSETAFYAAVFTAWNKNAYLTSKKTFQPTLTDELTEISLSDAGSEEKADRVKAALRRTDARALLEIGRILLSGNAEKEQTAFLYLKEIPSINALFGILLIIFGTYFVLGIKSKQKIDKCAIIYRVLALMLSGTEAIFIKKLILLSNVTNAFLLWVVSGFVFSLLFLCLSKNKPIIKSYKHQLCLIVSVGIMQYTTNYVFTKMNVAYTLALFQLSTIFSVFLGANIFSEENFKEKLIGAIIMVIGAVIIILN